MSFEAILATLCPQAVRAKPSAERAYAEGQRRDGKARQLRRDIGRFLRPVANVQGQITGRLVDTTA